ncbi:hypothetical protein KIH86_10930 [Paenibacillus sp. HN-1]|uniref:hypothetical protein n=1 Tax=Paenibacillus TaxID=44249 RepID=UPI001CA94520|nr:MULTISPECIES: hypothetical protein [Paenibacillus]MBY9077488.1 hypothetical protein [Paenibacillus sp. CGMCC 1.18879]MBY9084735.1 hypothetical protein [Paenibacillus sinensis]
MANFKKTEADFEYERYSKLRGTSPEQDIPADDIRLVGTETAQSLSGEATGSMRTPIESPFASHERTGSGAPDEVGLFAPEDEVLALDREMAEDVGLSAPAAVGAAPPHTLGSGILKGPAPGRDELLSSDTSFAAAAAGLTQGTQDYPGDEAVYEDGTGPLQDVPDAETIAPGSPVDPSSPPIDVMPGTDVLNGSTGEDNE